MWDARLDKEEGLEISGDENQLKSLQKKLGDVLDERLKLLKLIDPKCPPNTAIGERPVLVRFAKLFVAAGGHLDSPGDIVNHKIKADFFKRVDKVENGSETVLSQRRHHFINYLLAEKDVEQLERRISAPPAPSKPPIEVGGKIFTEFTEDIQSPEPVFVPAQTVDTKHKVTAQKAVLAEPGSIKTLKDIVFEAPGEIDFSPSPKATPSDKK
jgi:hypothetical protein